MCGEKKSKQRKIINEERRGRVQSEAIALRAEEITGGERWCVDKKNT